MCEKMFFLKNIKNQPYPCTVSKDELKRMSEAGERSLFRTKKKRSRSTFDCYQNSENSELRIVLHVAVHCVKTRKQKHE